MQKIAGEKIASTSNAQRSIQPLNAPRASAKPEVSPTPSVVNRNRGAVERSHIAHHPMTRTGPYDAIFDTLRVEDQEVTSEG
jgi:hypothetical protein